MYLGRSMKAASIGTPPEVPTEHPGMGRPVWNSGGVPGTEAVQQKQLQVRYMRKINTYRCAQAKISF